jgi:hypothetical protein
MARQAAIDRQQIKTWWETMIRLVKGRIARKRGAAEE